MVLFNIGRICVKTVGREVGKECVVVDLIDRNFALVTGPVAVTGVKRRRVNLNHLEPTERVLDIKKGASDEVVQKAMVKNGLTGEAKEPVKPVTPPPAPIIQAATEAEVEKVKKKPKKKKTTRPKAKRAEKDSGGEGGGNGDEA